jgi:hypothetical protein
VGLGGGGGIISSLIAVAKGPAQQHAHQRTLAVKHLCFLYDLKLSQRLCIIKSSQGTSVLKYPEDEDRDGPRNVGFFAIQPFDAAGRPKRFYYTCVSSTLRSVSPLNTVRLWMFPVAHTSCVPKCYQSVYCCLIRHFLVRIRTTKCFTNSSKPIRCELKFENGHMFCSWTHHVHSCITCAQLVSAAA